MRLALAAILLSAAMGGGVAASESEAEPFNGAWMACDVWQGAEICEYKVMVQRGSRVCGVQRYFATNAYYEQRFVGTAKANAVRIEKICGDPGSETDTYCSGRAPSESAKTGWQATDRGLALCGGGLFAEGAGSQACAGADRRLAMPQVDDPGEQGPSAEDRAWLASCAGGAD